MHNNKSVHLSWKLWIFELSGKGSVDSSLATTTSRPLQHWIGIARLAVELRRCFLRGEVRLHDEDRLPQGWKSEIRKTGKNEKAHVELRLL